MPPRTKRNLLEARATLKLRRERVVELSRWKDDPVGFVRDVLGEEPWEKQAQILDALATHHRVTVRSGHGVGKTFVAARACLWFLVTHPDSIVITTAPTWNQVRNLLWREIRSAFHGARIPMPGTCHTMGIDINDRWFALGLSTNDAIKFQGFHSEGGLLFVADEASGVSESIYEASKGFLTGANSYELLIGNPNEAQGTFYESFRAGRWERFHIPCQDAPRVTEQWIQDRLDEWGEESPVYQVRVLGEFPAQSENSLLSLTWLEAAQQRECAIGTPVEIGVDVGRMGNDESVAYVRAGERIVASQFWRGQDTMVSAGRVAALAREWKPRLIKVDEIGIGAGVLDRLVEQGLPAQGINVGTSAFDKEHFADKRTELYFGLQQRFKDGTISIPKDDQVLLDQLAALQFSYKSNGQLLLERKEDLRKRRGTASRWQSPDRADGLMLCLAVNVGSWKPAVVSGGERGVGG